MQYLELYIALSSKFSYIYLVHFISFGTSNCVKLLHVCIWLLCFRSKNGFDLINKLLNPSFTIVNPSFDPSLVHFIEALYFWNLFRTFNPSISLPLISSNILPWKLLLMLEQIFSICVADDVYFSFISMLPHNLRIHFVFFLRLRLSYYKV